MNILDPWGLEGIPRTDDTTTVVTATVLAMAKDTGVITAKTASKISGGSTIFGIFLFADPVNSNETQLMNIYNDMNAADLILLEAQILNEYLERVCKATGGCNYDANSCE